MSTERFTAFFQTFERILKNIRRIAMPVMQTYGLRSVHTNCLLAFSTNPSGLSVTELSRECLIDKSLASRVMKELSDGEYITPAESNGNKNYNKRYVLTPKSQNIMMELDTLITNYVSEAGTNIPDGDRAIFYRVLAEFDRSIEKIEKHQKREA